jgi:RNA polymerase sigma-70 factor (ECF subfamily)
MRNEHDAEDVMQDASLRAFRYFRTFMGGDGRAWFLRIVRNTCSGWRATATTRSTIRSMKSSTGRVRPAFDPEALLLQAADATSIAGAMRTLPDRFHRRLVLRELEGLSHRELADAMDQSREVFLQAGPM